MNEIENKAKNKKEEVLNETLSALRTVVTTSVVVFMMFQFLFTPVTVEGTSMEPTLESGQWGFSSLMTKYVGEYERFDVVVLNYEQKGLKLVKRIIGLPGEKVQYKDDVLYINDEPIKEEFLDEEYVYKQTYEGVLRFTEDFGPYYVREDEYFVVGDNRPKSTDSRVLGAFHKSDISSKSILVLWPISSFHFVGKK